MIYVTADLHGYSHEAFLSLLGSSGFCGDDLLFVLGDVVDRGEDGVRTLLWIMEQPNVFMILGNHEEMLLASRPLLGEVTDDMVRSISADTLAAFGRWMRNGGGVTARALNALTPEMREEITGFLLDLPLYERVNAGGREFLLVHGGLGGFDPGKPIEDYSPDELIWHRPSLDERYFDDVTTVFGHTPTVYYGRDFRGRALFTDTWIDVDTGASGGIPPMLLRLDDLKEFYAG